jgi:hypothetical protein
MMWTPLEGSAYLGLEVPLEDFDVAAEDVEIGAESREVWQKLR